MKPKKTKAKRLLDDPGFQYAFRMHAILQLFYANNKAERYRQYEAAGIGKALKAAKRRVAAIKDKP